MALSKGRYLDDKVHAAKRPRPGPALVRAKVGLFSVHQKIRSNPIPSIKSSKKLEPLWKYGSYLVIFLRNCFYSSCVKIGKQYFAKKLLFHR